MPNFPTKGRLRYFSKTTIVGYFMLKLIRYYKNYNRVMAFCIHLNKHYLLFLAKYGWNTEFR